MEHACERSYTRSIGVSNFGVGELHEVMAVARTPPVVDQIQYNPFAYREGLANGCARQNIALEAYSPLGTGAHLADPRSRRSRNGSTARRRRCSCAGASSAACPRVSESTHRDRIEENARVFDFSLSPTDTAQLDALDRSGRTDQALERTWWSS